MAHEVVNEKTGKESIAYRGEMPWHGLGIHCENPISWREALKLAGADFKVELKDTYAYYLDANQDECYEPVAGKFSVMRMDTNQVLGVVGGVYEIVQNEEAFGMLDILLSAKGVETCAALENGKRVVILSRVDSFEVIPNDTHETYFAIVNSFDGSTPLYVMFTTVRIVCANTEQAAIKGAKHIFKIKHTKSAHDRIQLCETILAGQQKYQDAQKQLFKAFSEKAITDSQLKEFVATFLPAAKVGVSTRTANSRGRFFEAYESGAGAEYGKGTVYALFQAGTNYIDHLRSVRSDGSGIVSNEQRWLATMFPTSSGYSKREELQQLCIGLL